MKWFIWVVLVRFIWFPSAVIYLKSFFPHDEHQRYERKRKGRRNYDVDALRKSSNTTNQVGLPSSALVLTMKHQTNVVELYRLLECSRIEIKLQENGQERSVKHLRISYIPSLGRLVPDIWEILLPLTKSILSGPHGDEDAAAAGSCLSVSRCLPARVASW